MRHNSTARPLSGGACSPKPVWRWILSILLLSIAFAPLSAEKEKPSSRPKSEQNSEQKAEKEAPGTESKSESQNSGGMQDIDRAWMESIRGEGRPEGKSFANPGSEEGRDAGQRGDNSAQESRAIPTGAGQDSPTASRMFATQEGPSFFSLFIRFVLFMGLMAGGFYGLVRFMKKKSGIVSSADGGPLRVVASISLMPGKYMQVVDMAGQLIVLGVSDQGVRLLQNIEDATVADRIRLWEENKPEPADNFLQGLQGLLKSTDFRLWKSRGSEPNRRADFHSILKGRQATDDVPMEDLEELLKQQNRRLRAVSKSRPTEEPG